MVTVISGYLIAIVGYFCLRYYRVRRVRAHLGGAMNRLLLKRLDFSMVMQMRACDKNIVNEVGNAEEEQILKNIFFSLQQDIDQLRCDPALSQMAWPKLPVRLKSIAAETVTKSSYPSKIWAGRLLQGEIEGIRKDIEKMPPSELDH